MRQATGVFRIGLLAQFFKKHSLLNQTNMNDNPNKMSNQDLENDMEERRRQAREIEGESYSHAAEGTLKSNDPHSEENIGQLYIPEKELAQDDPDITEDRTIQMKSSGNLPDPEEITLEDDKRLDPDEISS